MVMKKLITYSIKLDLKQLKCTVINYCNVLKQNIITDDYLIDKIFKIIVYPNPIYYTFH